MQNCVNYLHERGEEQQEQNKNTNEVEENYPLAFADFTSTNGWEDFQKDNFSLMAISKAFEMYSSGKLIEEFLNLHVVKLKTITK